MRVASLVLVVCFLVCPTLARDIYVAKTGSNGNSGGSGDPYLTIKWATDHSVSGDVIHVRAGTYSESWITVRAGTELVSEDGVHAAKIFSGNLSAIRLTNDNSGIDGFEIYGNWNQGSPIDGLIRPYGRDNNWIKNCLVHDAPHDGDVIKIGATNVLVENCVIYNAAHRTDGSSYQECVDTYGTSPVPDGITVRGCWIYHTPEKGGDYLIYAKGGSRNVLWENNVFGPAGGYGNVSTGCGAASPAVFPSCENFIARNNLFVGCNGDGAFGFTGAKNAHVYNNVFYDYRGSRCFIQFYSAQPSGSAPQNDRNEDCYVYNNIFMNSNGYPIYQDRGRWTANVTYIPVNMQHDYNMYFNCNTSPGSNDVDVTTEVNSIFADPKFAAPAVPDILTDTWASAVEAFELLSDSPAIDTGADLSGGAPYNVPTDINGATRPVGLAYDMGVYEFGAPTSAPLLISSDPPHDGTFARDIKNILYLTFDQPIPTPPALRVTWDGVQTDISYIFAISVEPDGQTIKVQESDPPLGNLGWYRFEPAAGYGVQDFAVDVCKVVGDADGDGTVQAFDLGVIWSHVAEVGETRYDTDGDGTVQAFDLGVAWAHATQSKPVKPY